MQFLDTNNLQEHILILVENILISFLYYGFLYQRYGVMLRGRQSIYGKPPNFRFKNKNALKTNLFSVHMAQVDFEHNLMMVLSIYL